MENGPPEAGRSGGAGALSARRQRRACAYVLQMQSAGSASPPTNRHVGDARRVAPMLAAPIGAGSGVGHVRAAWTPRASRPSSFGRGAGGVRSGSEGPVGRSIEHGQPPTSAQQHRSPAQRSAAAMVRAGDAHDGSAASAGIMPHSRQKTDTMIRDGIDIAVSIWPPNPPAAGARTTLPVRTRLLESEVWLPRPRAEVFAFFADAFNLQEITPPFLRFRVVTPRPVEMRVGAIIDYRLRVRGLPMRWRSEITAWDPPHRFVDEQVIGPYRLWRHEHTFEERDGGTLCRDRVEYAVPLDPLVHRLLVRPDVERIFAFRAHRLRECFPAARPEAVPV